MTAVPDGSQGISPVALNAARSALVDLEGWLLRNGWAGYDAKIGLSSCLADQGGCRAKFVGPGGS
jgi:hypothetical protein